MLARAIAVEAGKPLWEARTEVAAVAGKLEPTLASYRERLNSKEKSLQLQGVSGRVITEFRPLGTIGVIGPFNFPMHMPNGHIIPALLCGNAVVFKPSELAPLSANLYVQAMIESGLPSGLISVIHGGSSVGAAVSQHAGLNGICFTGSTTVGRKIENVCAERGAMAALEMGGDGVIIIDDFDDLRGLLLNLLQSCYISAGQRCSSARKILITKSSYENGVIRKFISLLRNISVGKPLETPEPYYGPMRTSRGSERVLSVLEEAKRRGEEILLEGEAKGCFGRLLTPSIIRLINEDWLQEEVIGPLIRVKVVEDFEEAVVEARRSSYGLAAGIITNDREKFEYFRDTSHYGNINWNAPLTGNSPWGSFGGTRRSGNFRPSGYTAVDYCVRARCSIERETSSLIGSVPVGVPEAALVI